MCPNSSNSLANSSANTSWSVFGKYLNALTTAFWKKKMDFKLQRQLWQILRGYSNRQPFSPQQTIHGYVSAHERFAGSWPFLEAREAKDWNSLALPTIQGRSLMGSLPFFPGFGWVQTAAVGSKEENAMDNRNSVVGWRLVIRDVTNLPFIDINWRFRTFM